MLDLLFRDVRVSDVAAMLLLFWKGEGRIGKEKRGKGVDG